MTARNAHLAAYQRMTRLYPSSFRQNYGADLVILFASRSRTNHLCGYGRAHFATWPFLFPLNDWRHTWTALPRIF